MKTLHNRSQTLKFESLFDCCRLSRNCLAMRLPDRGWCLRTCLLQACSEAFQNKFVWQAFPLASPQFANQKQKACCCFRLSNHKLRANTVKYPINSHICIAIHPYANIMQRIASFVHPLVSRRCFHCCSLVRAEVSSAKTAPAANVLDGLPVINAQQYPGTKYPFLVYF